MSQCDLTLFLPFLLQPNYPATRPAAQVVLGKSGKVEAVNMGNVADLETRLKTQLEALISATGKQ